MIQVTFALLSVCVVACLYVRGLSQTAHVLTSPRFRVVDLLMVTAAVALLCAAGFAGDAAVLILFLLYAAWAGPRWKHFIQSRIVVRPIIFTFTSAGIVGSFAALATIVAVVACIVGPPDLDKHWNNAFFPHSVFLSQLPGAMFVWACILGDNYRGNQLVVYGFPISIV